MPPVAYGGGSYAHVPLRFSSGKRKISFSVIVLIVVANKSPKIDHQRKDLYLNCPVIFAKSIFAPPQRISAYVPVCHYLSHLILVKKVCAF